MVMAWLSSGRSFLCLSLSLSLSLSSIVAPMDIGNWDGFKTNSKLGGSLFLKNKSDSLRSDTRSRLGSVLLNLPYPLIMMMRKLKRLSFLIDLVSHFSTLFLPPDWLLRRQYKVYRS